jgi:hypothetical protein
MGGYGLLTADDGVLDLSHAGRVLNLNVSGRGRTLAADATTPGRYRSLRPQRYWQNVTGTPDFPTMAEAVRQMWPQTGPGEIDGVLYVDPRALAALMELTGPVTVEKYDTVLRPEEAEDFFLKGQYVEFPDDDRHDFLVEAARSVFEQLTTRAVPGPGEIIDALGPAARQRRLLLHSFDDREQRLFEELRLDGALPPVDGDFLSVRASNRGLNKIDAFMERSIDYEVDIDPERGTLRATAAVTIRNDAPRSGLPRDVIGNHRGQPLGTNSTTVAVYSPLELVDVTSGGRAIGRGVASEYGRFVYTALLDVPPGGSVTVEFHLAGELDRRGGYRLDVVPQPLVNDDHLSVQVRTPPGWDVMGGSSYSGTFKKTVHLDAAFSRRL